MVEPLARVIIAQGSPEAALQLLNEVDLGTFGGIFAETVFGLLSSSRKLTYIVSPDDNPPCTMTDIKKFYMNISFVYC